MKYLIFSLLLTLLTIRLIAADGTANPDIAQVAADSQATYDILGIIGVAIFGSLFGVQLFMKIMNKYVFHK